MISVERFRGKSVSEHRVEVVERKGLGHPDFICDSIMEAISVSLSGEYKKTFGAVLHHNIDKGLLAAGKTEKKFGGGKLLAPIRLIIGDRATFRAGDKGIPVNEIAVSAAKKWIKENLRFVDPERHISYTPVLAEGSEELTDIFTRPGAVKGANDTSCAVGYFPLSGVEELVLGFEKYLNSEGFKNRFPETGEDVKVMGLRTGRSLDLTVAMPLMAGLIKSESEYFKRKDIIAGEMTVFLRRALRSRGTARVIDPGMVNVHFNALDRPGRGLGGVYLSLLGTSAEDADSGQVGRGNRVNGLISMTRPMGTEAAAGKNPVSHVGKIYNVLAHRAAREIHQKIEGVTEAYVLLLSRIGTPIDSPPMASAQVLLREGVRLKDISKRITGVLEKELSGIPELCDDLAEGKYNVC